MTVLGTAGQTSSRHCSVKTAALSMAASFGAHDGDEIVGQVVEDQVSTSVTWAAGRLSLSDQQVAPRRQPTSLTIGAVPRSHRFCRCGHARRRYLKSPLPAPLGQPTLRELGVPLEYPGATRPLLHPDHSGHLRLLPER